MVRDLLPRRMVRDLAAPRRTPARASASEAGNDENAPDLNLSSPATDAAARTATSSRGRPLRPEQVQQQQQQQKKARRCWSPELHRRFVAALQRLGGAQVATPKQIRELMKVDGLTNGEVKSHLQKYRLHTPRASSSDGGDHPQVVEGLWSPPEQQYTQSGSPQGDLQLTVSSRAMSATAGGSCDGGNEAEDGGDEAEGGRSESCSLGMQDGTKASSSPTF